MRMIGVEDIDDMALGATLLGTGGGGDAYIAQLMVKQAIEKYGPIKVVDAAELPPDGLVMSCAIIGAPTVILEKIPSGTEFIGVGQGHGQVLRPGPGGLDAHRGGRHEHARAAGHRRRAGPAGHRRRLDAACLPADRDDGVHARRPQGHAPRGGRREGQRVHLRGEHEPAGRGAGARRRHPPGHGQLHHRVHADRAADPSTTACRAR